MRYTDFKARYKDCGMQYSFKKHLIRREARVEQEKLLKGYVKKYGEVHRIIIIFRISILIGKISAIPIPPNLLFSPGLCMNFLPIFTIHDLPKLEEYIKLLSPLRSTNI